MDIERRLSLSVAGYWLLVAIYQVLLKQETYNPVLQGLTEIRNPDKTMSIQDAVRFAQQHGFNVV